MSKTLRNILQIVAVFTIAFELASIIDIVRILHTKHEEVSSFVVIVDTAIGLGTMFCNIGLAIALKSKKLYFWLLLFLAFVQLSFMIINLLPVMPQPVLFITAVLIFLNSMFSFYIGLNLSNLFISKIVKNIGLSLLLNSIVGFGIIFIQYIGFVNTSAVMVKLRFLLSVCDKITCAYFFVCVLLLFRNYSKTLF